MNEELIGRRLPIELIEKEFAEQWVLLDEPTLSPETGEVLDGVLMGHGVESEPLYEIAKEKRLRNIAMLGFQSIPEGVVYVL